MDGEGGGIYFISVQTSLRSSSSHSHSNSYSLLHFLCSYKRFMKNSAFKGRDIFILYNKRKEELNYLHFLFDENGRVSESGSSIIGKGEDADNCCLDLSPFLDYYRHNVVCVSTIEGDSTNSRGSLNEVCVSIKEGLNHLKEGEFSVIVIDDALPCVVDEIDWIECNVKAKGKNLGHIVINFFVDPFFIDDSSSCLMKSENNLNFVLI
jgi:hypothetical protein